MIKLDLHKHCIETEIKRLHNRCISMLLGGDADPVETEKKLTLLRNALDRLDFPRLRAAIPELAGNHRNDIKLLEGQEDRLMLMINAKVIDLLQYYKS